MEKAYFEKKNSAENKKAYEITWHVKSFTKKSRPSDKCVMENDLFYFSTNTYVVGTQKKRLNEKVLLSTQNKCLN